MARPRKRKDDEAKNEKDEMPEGVLLLVDPSADSLPEGVPSCPPWLDGSARGAWNSLATVLHNSGDATKADYVLLAAFCEEYEAYVEAKRDMRTNGRTQRTQTGYEQVRPQHGIAEAALSAMIKISKELALTRRSRSVVKSSQGDDNGEDNEFFGYR